MSKILGIDPGYRNVGFALLENTARPLLLGRGVIKTSGKDSLGKNLQEIDEDIYELLDEFQPDIVAIEQPTFDRNITTASGVHRAIGVIHLCVYGWMDKDPVFLHPSKIKATVAHGKANKSEIKEFVENYFEIETKSDHEADAIAIAFAYIFKGEDNIH